jgi:hypothetical protein
MGINDEWQEFITNEEEYCDSTDKSTIQPTLSKAEINYKTQFIPKCSKLYISTKSKIYYLNKNVPLDIFWKLPIINYELCIEGIIKKQIKYDSNNNEEIETLYKLLEKEQHYNVQIIKHNEFNDKFKDVRKVTIGLSNKDVINSRTKKKNAFFNCFVIIIRIFDDHSKIFKEAHVKVFNTGKIELPGIKNEYILNKTLTKIVQYINPFIKGEIKLNDENTTILINSNFNCNYYIDRAKMFNLLKTEYDIESMFDPCIYPGIQCKYYFNKNRTLNNGKPPKKEQNEKNEDFIKMSFMIFRTGSILIVGKCEEFVLEVIYEFLRNILIERYNEIIGPNQHLNDDIVCDDLNKTKKIRKNKKKFILIKYD